MNDYRNSHHHRKPDTIIRRKLTMNFTTIPNEIFERGLSPGATGLLLYLITRPPDWEVIPRQLCKQFGIGRDKTYRLLDELIAAGFVHRSYSALGGCSYTVFDQPTDPLPEKPEAAQDDPLPENTEAAPDPLPEKPLPEKPLPEKPLPEKPLPENTDALLSTDSLLSTDREQIRKIDASHRIALAGDADMDAPLHVNGFGKEAKQASGCPRKEASKQESEGSFDEEELGAIEFVQFILDGDGVPRTIGAIVAMCQQPGQYEYSGIDGRLLARAAKAGHFIRDRELLLTHRQADELRNGGGLEEEATNGYDGPADLDLTPGEWMADEPVSSVPADGCVMAAVGHAVGRSSAAGVGTHTRIVANLAEAEAVRWAIMEERRRAVLAVSQQRGP